MFRSVYKMILFGMLLLVIGGCTAQQAGNHQMNHRQKEGVPEITVKIKPGRISEKCIQTLPNQIIEYSFNCSKPISFNIHYHRGGKVVYPVSEKDILTSEGALNCQEALAEPSDKPQYFCLMWENPHDTDVSLNFKYTVKNIEDKQKSESK